MITNEFLHEFFHPLFPSLDINLLLSAIDNAGAYICIDILTEANANI